MSIKKAESYLRSYLKLSGYGFAGRLLSKEFKKYKREKLNPTCDLLTWCIKKALAELKEKK